MSVVAQLYTERLRTVEFPVWAEIADKLHFDGLIIEIAVEMQKMYFDGHFFALERRAVADGKHTLVTDVGHMYPHGINAHARPYFERIVHPDIGCGKAQYASYPATACDMPFQAISVCQPLRGFLHPAGDKPTTNTR